MSRGMKPVAAVERPGNYQWDLRPKSVAQWTASPMAAEADEANTISIYDVIGEDFWSGGGFTAQRMAGALRSIGNNPVTVNINSPGGDMFEGLAIYNLLAEHPGKVTVKVMGIAASAASIIAMAADEVLMGTGSMVMVHRAWGVTVGNHNDFVEAADLFQKFDESMADIYVQRTGLAKDEVFSLLEGANKSSDGTFLTVAEAIEKGFADGKFDVSKDSSASAGIPKGVLALRRIESALAAQGLTRKQRADLLSEVKGERDAAPAERDAGEELDAEADGSALLDVVSAISSNLSILGVTK